MGQLATYGAVDLPVMDNLAFSRRFSTNETRRLLAADAGLSPVQRLQVLSLVDSAERQSPEYRGLISTRDIVRAGVGAGIGYVAAKTTAGILGRAVGMPSNLQHRLTQAGAIGGALRGSGIWQ